MRFRVPRNLGWKIGSLLLAVVLWVAMSAEPEVVVSHDAAVLYQNLPENLMVSGDAPGRVRLELQGHQSQLARESMDGIAVVVDFKKLAGTSEQTLSIGPDQVSLPRGVTLLRSSPAQIRLVLAKQVRKEVPVEAQFVGSLPPGHRLLSATVVPERLEVVGPDNELSTVSKIQTDPIDLKRIAGSAELRVNAFVPHAGVHVAALPPVIVKLEIGRVEIGSTQNQ